MTYSYLRALLIRSGGVVFSFVLSLEIAIIFGAEGAGQFFLAQTIVLGVATISRLGVTEPTIRKMSPALNQGHGTVAAGVALTSILVVISVSAIATIVMFFIYAHVLPQIMPEKFETWRVLSWLSVMVVPIALSEIIGGILQAKGSPLKASFIEAVFLPMVTTFGLGAAYAWGPGSLSLDTLLYIYIASGCANIFLGAYFILDVLRPRVTLGRDILGDILKEGHPLLVVNALGFLVRYAPLIVLGLTYTPSDVGVYSVCVRTSMVFTIFLQSISTVVRPQFAISFAIGDKEKLQEDFRRASRFTAAISTPIILFSLFYSGAILEIFGQEFRSGALALQVLLVGQAVNMLTSCSGIVLLMSGHVKALRLNSIIVGVLSLPASLAFIPLFGILGAAAITSLLMSLQAVAAAVQAKRLVGINVFEYVKPRVKQ